MLTLKNTYLKYTTTNGESYYVDLYTVINDAPDSYQDETDGILYNDAHEVLN